MRRLALLLLLCTSPTLAQQLPGSGPMIPNGTTTTVLVGRQTFCASGCTATGGTYTPDTGTNLVDVQCVGGGGGGGGAASTGAAQEAIGASGGGASYIRKRITSGFSGVTVTIGAGGTGGPSTPGAGGAGGTTTFGALLTAGGGVGGGGGGVGAAGAFNGGASASTLPTGGDINVAGSGSADILYASTGFALQGAPGGAFALGLASRTQGSSSSVAGAAGSGYGSGGMGGANAASQGAGATGGAGSGGICIVDEYK